ncbi:methyltransferase [Bifidobacterium primatium]|uniref:Methyltransferase n=1 Tax=Bifidobacterium primatium TaxID=2045438 RepID=A0A2M9H8K8_9BIFI|nr:class I SAM-dependent methyltransferase [Bifidobacterium primatium]PJM73127.1 methyltransferase [Bifidobacterium primatium]
MNRKDFTNTAKGWEFIENLALDNETDSLRRLRLEAEGAGFSQGSAAQACFLAFEARQIEARSVIVLGTAAVTECVHIIEALNAMRPDVPRQLTAVDSSAQGTALIRRTFNRLPSDAHIKLRVVNAKLDVFLPRLNAGDYDLVIITGDEQNYEDAFDRAHRLLRDGGILVLCDVLALDNADSRGGLLNSADRGAKATRMRQLIDDAEGDERFDSTIIPTGTGLMLSVKVPDQA